MNTIDRTSTFISGNVPSHSCEKISTPTQAMPAATPEMLDNQSQDTISRQLGNLPESELALFSDSPTLRTPERALALNNSGKLLLLMASLKQNLSEMGINELSTRLAIFQSQSDARISQAKEDAARLDGLGEEWKELNGEVEGLQKAHTVANNNVDSAQKKYDSALQHLNTLLGEMEADAEGGPEIIAARQAVADSEDQLTTAKSTLADVSKTLDQKVSLLSSKTLHLNSLTEEFNRKYSDVLVSQPTINQGAQQRSEDALTRSGILIKLLAEFIAQIGENSTDKLKNDLALHRIQMEARQKEMQRKSDEYEEQVRKAEEAQKMASCIGKVLGGLAIAFGALTTLFGGAGLGLMAVGMGLMVADPILEALTGQSLTGMIMNPLMEHVLMPLMEAIGGIVAAIFDKTPLGLLLKAIDNATGANMMGIIHTVVTAAVVIAAIVALAFVAKNFAQAAINKMSQAMSSAVVQAVKKAIVEAIQKLVPQVVRNATRQGAAAANRLLQSTTQQISRTSSRIAENVNNVSDAMNNSLMRAFRVNNPDQLKTLMAQTLNYVRMAQTGVQTANPLIQGGMNINIATIQRDAMKLLSEFTISRAELEMLRRGVEKSLALFEREQQLAQGLMRQMSDLLQSNQTTGNHILRNMHA